MHLVFLCVIEICSALDVLILDRVSKKKRPATSTSNGNVVESTVQDVDHHDKTGLGSESWKHNQPLDVETEGLVDSIFHNIPIKTFILYDINMSTDITIRYPICETHSELSFKLCKSKYCK